MPKQLLTILLLFAATTVMAQPKGFKPVGNLAAFQQNLSKTTSAIQAIQSDFSQVKHLSLLSDNISSKGKFYYRKEDKVRIEYTTPFQYLLVMNAGQIMVKDEQKSSKINTKNSKTMQSVNRIMVDCMRGTVFSNPDFKVTAFESGNDYLLALVPANDAMKKMFRSIDVYLSRAGFDVTRLTLTELNGDFTDMNFSRTQRNPTLSDALFKVR